MAEQGFSPVLLLLWVLLFNFNMGVIHGTADSQDVSALNVMFSSMNSPGQLTGWQANGGDPCSGSWKGVTCSGSQVTEINLANLGLNGAMGYNLDNLKNLKTMDLSGNNLNGAIPYQLPPNLQRLNLAQNQLNGGVPYSISLMKNLNYLNLAHNQLQNQLVDMFGNLPNLNTLDLSFNSFTGNLPESFGYLTSLNSLYLQNNQFTGDINVLQDLPLQNLNVANNRFTGWIPGKLKNIQNLQSEGNSWSSGPAPPPPPYTPPPGRKSNPGSSNDSAGGGGKSGINGGGIAGIIIAFIVVGAVVAFFVIKKRRKGSFGTEKLTQDQPFSLLGANEVKDLKSVASSDPTTPKIVQREITIPAGAPMTLNPPPNDRHKPFNDDELQKRPAARRTHKAPKNVSVFSVADLQVSTGSFSMDNLIGEGSTGRIYKAQFSDGKVLAVKKIDSASLPNQDPENFIGVVSDVSQLNHSNITPLVGYCSEHGQCLLVYEYLKNGSLHDYLHLNDEFSKPLSWNTRVKIALGTARALEYLHEVCSPAVVHRNLKSTNILLDGELNPQLSDCGLADLVPTRTEGSNQNSGSGYGAPEVSMSGQYTHKSDVYSFGVVMLELLTGRMPYDSSRPRSEQSLVRWATPQLHDIDALAKMVDPALKELYPVKSLSRFADIVALCVQPEPEFRPPMSEVVQSLVTLVQRANMSKRTLQGSDSSNFRFLDDPDT